LSEFVKGVVSAINMIKYVYAAQPGKTAELLEAETLFKGRVLQNVKQIRDADFLKIPENKSLFDSMIFYRELAAKAVSLDEVSRKEKNIDLTKTLQSAENFEKQLVKKSSGFARRSQVNRFKTSDLQSKLKAGEVWIQIIRYHDYALRTLTDSSDKNQKIYLHNSIDEEQPVYAALLVFPGKQKPALVKIPSDGLETKYLNYYRNMINFDKEDSLSYQNYFGALEKLLFSQNQPIRKIYFCGDGVYNLININALRIPKRKKYLGEIFDIRLKTSPFAYSESNANRVEEANFYAVSDFKSKVNTGNDALSENRNRLPDLPGTIDEAQKASEAVEKMNLKPLQRLQSEANEKNIKSAKSPRVLHIATHGHFQPDLKQTQNNLMNAGLYLALDSANNGFLSAFEAANLALDGNELTFLSACETGLGQTFAMGEGVYGLQRAFKIAGAKYLIMSLWRVNDKITAEFAAEFYNEWSKTKNIEISFKNAQNKIKQKYKSPRFWAGFVLVE
jgi:CHAT domain-containing protein